MIYVAPTSNNKLTYDDAILYCQFCNHGGYNDWHMPDEDEWLDIEFSSWFCNDPSARSDQHRPVTPVRTVC